MLQRRTLPKALSLLPTVVALTCLAPSPPARADDSSPQPSALAAARNLLRVDRQIRPTRWQGGACIPPTSATNGNAYEITANVEGRVGCGDDDMLLLKMRGISIDAAVPHALSPTWMDSGAQLRLIVRDNAAPADGSAGTGSRAAYLILAAAPEVDVAALEPSARSAVLSSATQRASGASRIDARLQSVAANLPKGHPICNLPDGVLAIYPYYRNAIWRINPRLDETTLDKITSSLLGYSWYYKIDPRLIMAMIIAESSFDPQSTSRTGAVGLGQLMPGTAAGLGVNPFDPVQNVGGAVKLLSSNVSQYGGADANGIVPMNTLLLTMAAYNAGGGAVRRYHGVPPYRETQNYVRKVSALYRRMCGG